MQTFTVHVTPSALVVEPPLASGTACLCMEASGLSRRVLLSEKSRSAALEGAAMRTVPAFAVLGMVQLLRGPYLLVCTRARPVVQLAARTGLHMEVFQVLAVDSLPLPKSRAVQDLTPLQQRTEARFLQMLQEVFDMQCLYFSHDYDVTQKQQRLARIEFEDLSDSQFHRADDRFMWNRALVEPFLQGNLVGWVHPMMCGYVACEPRLLIGQRTFSYVFFSRRSRHNQGTRFIKRGLDTEGNAANFVETEQIFIPQAFDDQVGPGVEMCSFVQTRGSIPTFWSQEPNLKYAPKVKLTSTEEEAFGVFEKHFAKGGQHDLDEYLNAVCVNLVDRTGKGSAVQDQRGLGCRYDRHVQKLGDPRLKYVWFDFHHECKKGKYQNVRRLVKQIKDSLQEFGFFVKLRDGSIAQEQTGVVRTNCMDNLDRTNVVQTVVARANFLAVEAFVNGKSQEDTIERFLKFDSVLESPEREFEEAFQRIWRSNANTMSVLYAGTPALKTRRGALGKIQDAMNSVTRYFINNFQDARKQDALDLLLGSFDVESIGPDQDIFEPDSKDETLFGVLVKAGLLLLLLYVSISASSSVQEPLKVSLSTLGIVLVSGASHALRRGISERFVSKPSLLKFKQL